MLRHPNIIEYYENFVEDKAVMIVMEYAPGGTLRDFLQRRGTRLLDEEVRGTQHYVLLTINGR